MFEFIVGATLFTGVFFWSIAGSRRKEQVSRTARYSLDGEGIAQYLGPINWLKAYGMAPASVCDIKVHPSARKLSDLPPALSQAARESYAEGFAPGPEMAAALGRDEPLPPGFLFHFVLRKQEKTAASGESRDILEMWVVAKNWCQSANTGHALAAPV